MPGVKMGGLVNALPGGPTRRLWGRPKLSCRRYTRALGGMVCAVGAVGVGMGMVCNGP